MGFVHNNIWTNLSASRNKNTTLVFWITCLGLLLSKRECMSVDRQTKLVSRHKMTCQRYMMLMYHICLYIVETIPDTNYGQLCTTDRYLNRRFWQVWTRQEKSYNFSFMLSLFKFNRSVSVCMPNNLGSWQDQSRLSDPNIPGMPEMGCLRPFVLKLEKLYCFVCRHCSQSTSKPHWIHMKQEQSLI